MKNRKLLIFGVAAGFCMVSVFALIGCMGFYADGVGTQEIVSDAVETESVDIIAETLTDNSKEAVGETTEPSAEDAVKTDEEGATELAAAEVKKAAVQYEKMWKEMSSEAAVQYQEVRDGDGFEKDEVFGKILTPNETGIIVLQEINRLYGDNMEGMYVSRMNYASIGDGWNGQWSGFIENHYDASDERYQSYQFTVDAVSGEILEMSKFQSYQVGKGGSGISWTEEEMLEHAKKLVEDYQLMPDGELDWESAKVILCDDTQLQQAEDEINEEPDTAVMLTNCVIFYQNGNQQFMVETDRETGELMGYYRFDLIYAGQSTRLIRTGDYEYFLLGNPGKSPS